MKVKIEKMKMVNFKGIRDLTIELTDKTSIEGANGTGKTTVFDAFLWVLFGKDSQGRSDFNVKTLDANGNAIAQLPHEVTVLLSLDGELHSFKRTLAENWVTKRGSATPELKGHTESRYCDDVPMSVAEYKAAVAEICDETTFRMITNPNAFVSQPASTQRQQLLSMGGEISQQDIAGDNEDFLALIADLRGRTEEQYKKVLTSEIKRVKQDMADIPARIDENNRLCPEEVDMAKVEAEINDLSIKQAELIRQRESANALISARKAQQAEVTKQIDALYRQASEARQKAQREAWAEYSEQQAAKLKAERDLRDVQREQRGITEQLTAWQRDLSQASQKRESARALCMEIRAREFVMDENLLICPTCKRPLDAEDATAKREDMLQSYNTQKAADFRDAQQQGINAKAAMEHIQHDIDEAMARHSELTNKANEIMASADYNLMPQEPRHIEEPAEVKVIEFQIDGLRAKLEEPTTTETTPDVTAQILEYNRQIVALQSRLKTNDVRAKYLQRNAELDSQLARLRNELANLEGKEYTLAQFQKARVEMVEGRINSMFSLVKWKLYEQQINGGERETCEATVNGVPYRDLNTATKLNAGLDIISAISKGVDIEAPIFIDNRESVTNTLDIPNQQIDLVVNPNYPELHIINN